MTAISDPVAGHDNHSAASQSPPSATVPGGPAAGDLRNALVDTIISNGLVRTPRIEQVMRAVPRHLFVPAASLDAAYANSTVDVKLDSDGKSISCASQPGVVGLMLEQLQPGHGHNILELGAGTGYNAALLACLAGPDGHVTTIDIDDDTALGARAHLGTAGITNVTVITGDAALGYPDHAPYDRIVATVGTHGIPPAWMDQLAPGGRLLVPQRLRGSVCRSVAYERHDGTWRSVSSEMNTFMPLRQGIAPDPRRMISLTADGSVLLQTNSEQNPDSRALTGVLSQPRTLHPSGLFFGGAESAEWMELWLACTLPGGLNQMPATQEAIDRDLVIKPYRSSSATFSAGALTYLCWLPTSERGPDGYKISEFGVVAHGPGSEDLARRVIESMQAWDRGYRTGHARFEIHPPDARPGPPAPGRFSVSTPLNQLIIEWQQNR